jgi:hypothetical protein
MECDSLYKEGSLVTVLELSKYNLNSVGKYIS